VPPSVEGAVCKNLPALAGGVSTVVCVRADRYVVIVLALALLVCASSMAVVAYVVLSASSSGASVVSAWSMSSPANYVVIGEDLNDDGFADVVYVRDGRSGYVRRFSTLDDALSYADSGLVFLVFLKSGKYVLHSTFPSGNMTGRMMLVGEGKTTIIYSSGAFDAINTTLLPVRDVVFQRADGSFADASFDPNIFGEILRDNTVDREITYWKAVEGCSFVISYRFESVASGGNATILIVNPSGSGVRITIEAIVITGTGQGKIDIMTDVTFDGYAGTLTPRNRNLGTTAAGSVTAYYGAHLSSLGMLYMYGVLPGGSGKYATGDTMSYAVCILDEGHNVCIVVENTSSSSIDVSIVVFYFEDEA